ncbi:wax ester/triacylglycerol synthase family O-acyltransferase [Mycolicibacterium sp. 22603]|uniref:wax ester/triacylglycerol synthase family O-acyltransferase n=1 Tax=Mycolicibacterium sp. 22603 TaxID=3453950 RepID=UPI003F878852
MERLNAFDAGFLDAEDADQHISMAVGALAILAGPVPDHAELMETLGNRIRSMPRLRQVVRRHALDLMAPEWVEDPALDLAHHLRRAALPRPGDDAALFTFAAEAMEARLDRERPLWQCWVIEGLTDGRWALLMKVHHCIADGIATMEMLTGLCDDGDGQTYVDALRARRTVEDTASAGVLMTMNPLRWARTIWDTASAATGAATATIGGTIQIIDSLLRAGPPNTLNGPVTTMRRFSAVGVPLADVDAVCHSFGVTLNDVALSAVTDGFRAALKRRGEVPQPRSLRTLVPVSVRSDDRTDTAGNRVSVMLPYLPVDQSDPVQQLHTVHRRLKKAKSSGQRQAGSYAAAALSLVPFAITSRAIRVLTALPQRGVVTLATNVPGPRAHLHVLGREVVRMVPIPPVALRLRAAVAILSYGDELVFGIIGDFDSFPDVDDLAAGIARAVAHLAAAARKPHPGRPALVLVESTEATR